MATNNLSSTIVLQLLTNENYENWKAWMKNYLLAHDLWDIVEATTEPPKLEDDVVEFKAWRKNNAAALHAIQISCGVDTLPEIREIDSAKIVWDKLATMYGPGNSSSIPADPLSNIQGEGSINNDLLQYEPLRTAINNGDWVSANDFLSRHENAKSAPISVEGGTALHVAALAGHTEIVEKLVELMLAEQAAVLQNTGHGVVDCINIPDNLNRIPVVIALEYGNIEVALHLYSVSLPHQTLSDIDASTLLTLFMRFKKFDIALDLLRRCPGSALVPNRFDFPLATLASMSSAFWSGNQLSFLENWIYSRIPIPSEHYNNNEIQIDIHNPNQSEGDRVSISEAVLGVLRRLVSDLLKFLGIKQIYEMKLLHHQARQLLIQMCSQVKQMDVGHVNGAIFQAIKNGFTEFIVEIVKVDPQLLYTNDDMGRSILSCAVLHRQAGIFNHINGLHQGVKKSIINVVDKSGSTILHMAAMLEPSTKPKRDRITGEALMLQSEFQWFQKVERICNPLHSKVRNDKKMTPRELFAHNHKDMVKEGEKWMKDTARSCTVVGALIITITFTAAFTVPGGNNQNTGFPMFADKTLFTVFIFADALSLVYSTASVLAFLGILTSRYAEEDFLVSLPEKMIMGLFYLFLSIATMMITFCAALFLMVPGKPWIAISVIILTIGTINLFVIMESPIVLLLFKSTF